MSFTFSVIYKLTQNCVRLQQSFLLHNQPPARFLLFKVMANRLPF